MIKIKLQNPTPEDFYGSRSSGKFCHFTCIFIKKTKSLNKLNQPNLIFIVVHNGIFDFPRNALLKKWIQTFSTTSQVSQDFCSAVNPLFARFHHHSRLKRVPDFWAVKYLRHADIPKSSYRKVFSEFPIQILSLICDHCKRKSTELDFKTLE